MIDGQTCGHSAEELDAGRAFVGLLKAIIEAPEGATVETAANFALAYGFYLMKNMPEIADKIRAEQGNRIASRAGMNIEQYEMIIQTDVDNAIAKGFPK